MATPQQRTALLAVACPWCYAAPGEPCTLRSSSSVRIDSEGGQRRTSSRGVSTLDGGCHDARWKVALGMEAPVIRGAVLAAQGQDDTGAPRESTRESVPTLVGAGAPERPW